MKMQFLAASLLVITSAYSSSCSSYTMGRMRQTNCDDGNSYTTFHYDNGNSQTTGSNYNTGSTWNSNTINVGNSSFTSGIDSSGNLWSETQKRRDRDDDGSNRRRKSYGYDE